MKLALLAKIANFREDFCVLVRAVLVRTEKTGLLRKNKRKQKKKKRKKNININEKEKEKALHIKTY
jgi:hypothetical protein